MEKLDKKIKVIKRTMYGRFSFELFVKAKGCTAILIT